MELSQTEKPAQVGVVGIGDMGRGIALSMLRADIPIAVYDVRQEAVDELVGFGATRADSIRELASTVPVISIIVVDDTQVHDVVDEILAVATPTVKTILIHSTVLPMTVVAVAAQASQAHGIRVIDAAVTGGKEKGLAGTLTVLIGGDPEPVKECWPIFEAMGEHLFHAGPSGSGTVAKLINNTMSLGGQALLLEAMQLGAAYGLDEDQIAEFLAFGTGDSRGSRTWGRFDRIRLEHTFSGTAQVHEHFTKDLREAALAGAQAGVNLPLISTIGELLPRKFAQRQALVSSWDVQPTRPRCSACDQELAIPYRAAGVHPECAAT